MSEGIPLLPQATPGWEWTTTEVNISGQVFTAMIQQRLPEPPKWWEVAEREVDYGHALAALTFLVMAAKKIRDAWRGKAT